MADKIIQLTKHISVQILADKRHLLETVLNTSQVDFKTETEHRTQFLKMFILELKRNKNTILENVLFKGAGASVHWQF